jgi:peptidoglycan-associated lipoprotein
MMRKYRMLLSAVLVVVVATACAKQPATTVASAPPPTGAAADRPGMAGQTETVRPVSQGPGAAAPTTPAVPAPAAATATRPAPGAFVRMDALRDIHFDFDTYVIRPGDAKILDANANWLKTNPKYLVMIEGHCDARGTNEYNVVLGERRAKATLNYLVARGVAATRITMVSYGEERPLCADRNEACWAKNRRAQFLAQLQ